MEKLTRHMRVFILVGGTIMALLLIPVLMFSAGTPGCAINSAQAQSACADQETQIAALNERVDRLLANNDAGRYVESALQATISAYDVGTETCDNGLERRLFVGAFGRVIPEPPLPSTLRDVPQGAEIGQIPAGGSFMVEDGPQCGTNGITYWQVRGEDGSLGWVSEGSRDSYFIEPLDINNLSDSERAAISDIFEFNLGAACPFVYTHNGSGWAFDTSIIYEQVGAENERLQGRPLQHFDGRLLIREEEPETSSLDLVFVRVTLADGTTTDLYPDIPALREADDQYHVLHQGDELLLTFAGFSALQSPVSYEVYAEGYYLPY